MCFFLFLNSELFTVHPSTVSIVSKVAKRIVNCHSWTFLTIFTTMASQFRGSFQHRTPTQDLQTDNLEFIPSHSSGVQQAEGISNSPSAPLTLSPNNYHCWAKQELQCLWDKFTSWLQPEKQSKEQMISQLVLKQFLLTGLCKDENALTEKWQSSGRDMRRFMESLTDECLKHPVMVSIRKLSWKERQDHLGLVKMRCFCFILFFFFDYFSMLFFLNEIIFPKKNILKIYYRLKNTMSTAEWSLWSLGF